MSEQQTDVGSAALPRTPEELTAAWMSDALGRDVAQVNVEHIIWGTATKVLLSIDYAGEEPGAPARVCAKGGLDERLAGYGLGPAYILEANFFRELAPRLELTLPSCHFAATAPEAQQGIVLLEDLTAQGVRFGEPTEPWSPDLVAGGLETLAALHGSTWGATTDGIGPWIEVGAGSVRAACDVLLSADHWAAQRALDGGPVLPDQSQCGSVAEAFRRLWELDDAAVHCVTHGDAHIGNTYIPTTGRPGLLDWQAVNLGPWSYDVAYFVGGTLTVEHRREAEEGLLRHYLDALAASGGPRLDWDAAWLDYRRHALHGFLWALTPPVMQPLERVNAMAERHLQHMEDLETLVALAA